MSFENSHNLTNNINNNNNSNNNNRNDEKLITIKEEKLNYQRYFLKHDNFSEHTSSFIRTNFEQLNPHHHHYQQQLNSAMFSKNYQSENLLHHDIGSFDDFKKRKKSKDEYSLIKNDSNVRVSYILEIGPNSCKPPPKKRTRSDSIAKSVVYKSTFLYILAKFIISVYVLLH